MNFYSDGATIGVSLTIWGLLFGAYISFEIHNLIKSRMLFLHKLFLYFKIKRALRKRIPKWWSVKDVYMLQIFSVRMDIPYTGLWLNYRSGIRSKLKKGKEYTIVVPVDLHRNIDKTTINTWVGVNMFGTIKENTYLETLEKTDKGLPENVLKKHKRDSILEELGI
jgi:hypothetical protein